MEPHTYHWSLRTLHWLMALVILGLIAAGWWMTGLEDGHPQRGLLYGLHKSFGVIALGLLAMRILLRFVTPVPPLPSTLPSTEKWAAHAGHLLLYLGMLAVPVSGMIMSMAGGYGVKVFGVPLPNILPEDKAMAGLAHELHEILPYVLLGIIVLHMTGALKHRLADKPEHDVLHRMGIPRKTDSGSDA